MNWGEMGGITGVKHDLYIHFLLLLLSSFIFLILTLPLAGCPCEIALPYH
jgi:hypothetical protein